MNKRLAWTIVFLICLLGFGIMHEQAHVQINKYNGVDSQIHMFKYFPNLVTEQTNSSQICNQDCINSHSLNDSVGYPLLIVLTAFGFAIFLLLKDKNERI